MSVLDTTWYASVSQVALRDISAHLLEQCVDIPGSPSQAMGELFITPKLLNTKENRRLNRMLGLRDINKGQ